MQLESSGVNLGDLASCGTLPAHTSFRMPNDRMCVKVLEWEGSKIIATVKAGRPSLGEVVAVGKGCYPWKYNRERTYRWYSKNFQPTEVKVGDKVYIGEIYTFPQILIGNELHVLCREADVCLAVPESEAA